MILELEQQVTSLELSRKLKELGCSQETLFYWLKKIGTNDWSLVYKDIITQADIVDGLAIAAYTVAELLQMMPDWICLKKNGNNWQCSKKEAIVDDISAANALAKTAVYILTALD